MADDFHNRSKSPAYTPVPRVRPGADGRSGAQPGTPHEKAADPELGTGVIDQRRYTSREFMRLEWERLWTKVWLVAGRSLDMPEAGDYIVTEIGASRSSSCGRRMAACAASTMCASTAATACGPAAAAPRGARRTFKCLYHHWEYNLDGSYYRIPDIDTFAQGAPPRGLPEVKCEEWGGFVWYSHEPRAPSRWRIFCGPFREHLDPYHFERMVQTRDITVEWDCNWKTSVDAFNESYHVQGIHPQLLWYLHDLDIQIDCYERHSRYLIPFGTLSPRVRKPPSIPDPIKAIMKVAGMDPADYDEPIANIRARRAEAQARAWAGAGQGLFGAERRSAHR